MDESSAAKADPVRRVSALSYHGIHTVAGDFSAGLKRLLAEQVRQLQHCYDQMDSKAAEKPDGSGAKFQNFSAGAVEDFHKGLTDRVGKLERPTVADPTVTDRSATVWAGIFGWLLILPLLSASAAFIAQTVTARSDEARPLPLVRYRSSVEMKSIAPLQLKRRRGADSDSFVSTVGLVAAGGGA